MVPLDRLSCKLLIVTIVFICSGVAAILKAKFVCSRHPRATNYHNYRSLALIIA